MSKTLLFDATEVKTIAATTEYLNVEITTYYPNEILDSFDSDEIIKDYSDLDKLYEALKDHFD
jgi:hypothetical protein